MNLQMNLTPYFPGLPFPADSLWPHNAPKLISYYFSPYLWGRKTTQMHKHIHTCAHAQPLPKTSDKLPLKLLHTIKISLYYKPNSF